jgi:hypothetical protein
VDWYFPNTGNLTKKTKQKKVKNEIQPCFFLAAQTLRYTAKKTWFAHFVHAHPPLANIYSVQSFRGRNLIRYWIWNIGLCVDNGLFPFFVAFKNLEMSSGRC